MDFEDLAQIPETLPEPYAYTADELIAINPNLEPFLNDSPTPQPMPMAGGSPVNTPFGGQARVGFTYAKDTFGQVDLDKTNGIAIQSDYDKAGQVSVLFGGQPVFGTDSAGNTVSKSSLFIGPETPGQQRVHLVRDVSGNYAQLGLDWSIQAAWRCDWNAGGRLSWLVHAAPVFTIEPNGNASFAGELSAPILRCGSTMAMIPNPGVESKIYLQAANFLRSDPNGVFSWNTAGGVMMQLEQNGSFAVKGDLKAGAAVHVAGGSHMHLDTDNVSYSRIMCDAVGGSYVIFSLTTKKFVFVADTVVVASIDGAGNLVIKGNFTPNGSPG